MSYQNENFGMMDQGYFVPRTQILTWINDLLHLDLTKIQQLGSGAVYCQIIDVIHPGKIALSKLNWKARNDYQFISNMKLLQSAFDKIGIKRHLEVQKLSKAKYQDNLQLIQWLKRYYDLNCGERGNNYMPQQRRGNVVIDLSFADKNIVPRTFNGSGAVKNQVIEKKKTGKQQQGPSRIKSPVRVKSPVSKKVQIKKTKSPSHRNIKTAETLVSQKSDSGVNTSVQAKTQNTENMEHALRQKYSEQIESLEQQLSENMRELMIIQQSRKHDEIKMDMIKQILKGSDEAIMKMSLIEQIMNE